MTLTPTYTITLGFPVIVITWTANLRDTNYLGSVWLQNIDDGQWYFSTEGIGKPFLPVPLQNGGIGYIRCGDCKSYGR